MHSLIEQRSKCGFLLCLLCLIGLLSFFSSFNPTENLTLFTQRVLYIYCLLTPFRAKQLERNTTLVWCNVCMTVFVSEVVIQVLIWGAWNRFTSTTCCVCFDNLLTENNNWKCTGQMDELWVPFWDLTSCCQSHCSCSHFRPQINLLSICSRCVVPACSFYPLLLHPPSSPLTCPGCHPHLCINPPLPAKSASLWHLWVSTFSSFPVVPAHKWVRDYSCAKSLVWEGRLLWIKHYMLGVHQGATEMSESRVRGS